MNFELKKIDTIHKYDCTIKKDNTSNKEITFNVCGLIFNYKKDDDSLTKVKLKDINENNLLTFNEFFKLEKSDTKNMKTHLFFLEKVNDDTYLKYPVKRNYGFYEIESYEKLYKKFN